MEGRWTIHFRLSYRAVEGKGPSGFGAVPVVPCDDAAIERAEAAFRNAKGFYVTAREAVEIILRAAGETPDA